MERLADGEMAVLSHRPPLAAGLTYRLSAQGNVFLKPAIQIPPALLEFIRDESGQDLIEYALVAGLIGLGAVVAMSGLSTKIKAALNSVGSGLSNAI
jgi:pilus assembly protein Flp/PilA